MNNNKWETKILAKNNKIRPQKKGKLKKNMIIIIIIIIIIITYISKKSVEIVKK